MQGWQKPAPDLRQAVRCRTAANAVIRPTTVGAFGFARSSCEAYPRSYVIWWRKHMTNVVIASAARTAVGSFGGSFANTPAHDLGAAVLEALVARAGIDKAEVSETILGQVLTAAQGQNPARQAHVNAGLPIESAAWSINQVCGSGLRAVALDAQPPCRASARRAQDGRHEVYRHDDPRRSVGCLQRVSHGSDRRERRREMADQPRPAGRIRGGEPEQGRSGAERGQVRRRGDRLYRQDPEGRYRRRQG